MIFNTVVKKKWKSSAWRVVWFPRKSRLVKFFGEFFFARVGPLRVSPTIQNTNTTKISQFEIIGITNMRQNHTSNTNSSSNVENANNSENHPTIPPNFHISLDDIFPMKQFLGMEKVLGWERNSIISSKSSINTSEKSLLTEPTRN